jgi:hypothetical protein
MNSTLAYLRGRRLWVVESFAVWGTDSDADFYLAVAETVDTETRIGFWPLTLGGLQQEVSFSSLVDNKGNTLPAEIRKPSIIPVPRGRRQAFIKAVLGSTGFRIAAADDRAGQVIVDLLIFETGAYGITS